MTASPATSRKARMMPRRFTNRKPSWRISLRLEISNAPEKIRRKGVVSSM